MLVRDLSRRSFLHGLTGGSLAAFTTPGLWTDAAVGRTGPNDSTRRCHLDCAQ